MTIPLEYDGGVQRLSSASSSLFGWLVLRLVPLFAAVLSVVLCLASSGAAQINGAPPSVTSVGFGGRAVNGTPPSVTSLGRNGYAGAGFHGQGFQGADFHGEASRNNGHHHHHTVNGYAYYPYAYAVPVPYSVDVNDSNGYDEDDDSSYQGGPTIFDRRGSGRDSYIPTTYPGPAHSRAPASDATADATQTASAQAAPAVPETPQPATLLVFKDGHQVEVGNYAIVGQTLYDLAPGPPRKIALADLDVSATQKQNDDRGVTFELPPSAQAN